MQFRLVWEKFDGTLENRGRCEWAVNETSVSTINATINKTQPIQSGFNRKWLQSECGVRVWVRAWLCARCLRFNRTDIDHTQQSVTSHTQWHALNRGEYSVYAFLAYRVFGYQNIRRDFWFSPYNETHAHTQSHTHKHTHIHRTRTYADYMPGPVLLYSRFESYTLGELWFPLSHSVWSHFVGGPLCIVCARCTTAELLSYSMLQHSTEPTHRINERKNQVVCKESESEIICTVFCFVFSWAKRARNKITFRSVKPASSRMDWHSACNGLIRIKCAHVHKPLKQIGVSYPNHIKAYTRSVRRERWMWCFRSIHQKHITID